MDFLKDEGSKGLWALEYSTEQKCFHLDTLSRILKLNATNCLNESNNDYQVIFVGTREQCCKFSEEMRKQKNETN